MLEKYRLERSFFSRPSLLLAEELIGKLIFYHNHIGIITETEAYCGENDPASHAFRGITPRTKIMFGHAGHVYVYFIYGMYYCLNITSDIEGTAGAVLIRGMQMLSYPTIYLNGPGKLCRHLHITKEQNEIDLTTSPEFYVADLSITLPYIATPRIGIKVGTEFPWRFLADKKAVAALLQTSATWLDSRNIF